MYICKFLTIRHDQVSSSTWIGLVDLCPSRILGGGTPEPMAEQFRRLTVNFEVAELVRERLRDVPLALARRPRVRRTELLRRRRRPGRLLLTAVALAVSWILAFSAAAAAVAPAAAAVVVVVVVQSRDLPRGGGRRVARR